MKNFPFPASAECFQLFRFLNLQSHIRSEFESKALFVIYPQSAFTSKEDGGPKPYSPSAGKFVFVTIVLFQAVQTVVLLNKGYHETKIFSRGQSVGSAVSTTEPQKDFYMGMQSSA